MAGNKFLGNPWIFAQKVLQNLHRVMIKGGLKFNGVLHSFKESDFIMNDQDSIQIPNIDYE